MLTELQVKNIKPKEKIFIIRDDKGLYLRVDVAGRKYWILRYWENKKEHQLSLGAYPDLSLKDPRIMRDEIQTDRAKGKNPSRKSGSCSLLFTDITKEWLKVRMSDKDKDYIRVIKLQLNKHILPYLGDLHMPEITSGQILQICRMIENEGYNETAKRVKTIIGQICRFAIASGYVDTDPTSALLGALRPKQNRYYATITNPSEIAI